jgi:hypothetical protein
MANRRLTGVLMLGVALSTSEAAAAAQAPSSGPVGIVRGRVVAADTNAPVPDATVVLEPLTPQTPTVRADVRNWWALRGSTPVDADGRFEIQSTSAGQFRLVATPPPSAMQYLQTRYPDPTVEEPLALSPGQIVDVVIALPRAAAIWGRVVDERGAPLSLISISAREVLTGDRLRPAEGLPPTLTSRTDDTGSFRLFGLRPGEYVIMAERMFPMPNRSADQTVVAYPPLYYPGRLSPSEAQRIAVRFGEEHGPIEFPLVHPRLRTIRGMLVDVNGAPVADAKLTLQKASSRFGETPLGIGRTTSDGSFELRQVPPGEYAISAFRYGTTREFAWTIVSGNDDIDGLVVRLQAGVGLEGLVIFEGIPPRSLLGLRVKPVESAGASQSPAVQVSDDGSFALEHLFGPTVIRIEGLPRWHLKRVTYGDKDITDEPTEFVEAGPNLRVVVSQQLSILTGTVTNDRGAASQAAVVLLAANAALRHERSTMTRLVTTDDAGRYRIEGVRAGHYLMLAARRDAVMLTDTTSAFFNVLAKYATPVVIGEREAKTLDLMLTTLK